MKKAILNGLLLLSSLLFSACATDGTSGNTNTESLSSLQNLSSTSKVSSSTGISNLRGEALQETALTIGAQSGLAWRSKQIDSDLKTKAIYMRNVFNFSALMLKHGVQPPVLEEGNNTLAYASDDAIRLSDKTYKIVEPAKFVTTPPNWRDYLWMDYKSPEAPNKTLLPRTQEEEKVWKKYVTIGWNNGIVQAETIFQQNLAKLKRDYNGMLLYRELLSKKMISKPYVATTNLGVTGDGNSININDQILRITATPQLQTNSKEWQPVVVK